MDAATRLIEAVRAAEAAGMAPGEAINTVTCADVESLLHAKMTGTEEPIAVGLGASPGAASGQVYFTADDAADAYDRGEDVILVATETSPEDVHGMEIAEGILTTRGGLASHAAVVARGWGKPAVCGAEGITISGSSFVVDQMVINSGDIISINGTTGEVFLGAVGVIASDPPPELDVVLGWADEIRASKMSVRANADNGADAAKARQFGAEGIGLCRTEHQFLGERLPLLRRFLTAADPQEEADALEQLWHIQQADFEAIFHEMDGLPVTIRLLDAPLHEFCPDIEALDETNPMLGTRGVRLGILRPRLFRMQTHAMLAALEAQISKGAQPILEIMVPLIVNEKELALVRSWIEDEVSKSNVPEGSVLIGAMIETPRAALNVAAIGCHSDFFSFGTNDLTQMTLGFSRDDVEARLVGHYIAQDILEANPFKTIDTDGVGRLVHEAAQTCRSEHPNLKLGVCGEHGGDPASIELFWAAGLDYVSCSPYRVPVARVAVAQAISR